MTQKIVIEEKFRDLIPALSDDEYAQLEENIERDGCLDPLRLWRGHILIDGHHRLEICRKLKKPYQTVEILGLDTEEDVKEWIYEHQLGKRNLNPDISSYLRGKLYEVRKGRQGGDHQLSRSEAP
jgi:ParB-like chromosome segregation protein Spo0J